MSVDGDKRRELDPRIKIRAPLRCDGIGRFDCAEDTESGGRLAVRWLPLDANGEAAAKACESLPTHPTLPRILQTGQVGGSAFVAMDFPDGQLLSTWVGDRLEVEQVIRLAVQLSDALATVHEQGIMHGELSPDSVLVVPTTRALLWDLPLVIANRLTDRRGESRLMQNLTRTAPYLAPERARGGPCSRATDVYSLGAVLCVAAGAPLPSGTSTLGVVHLVATGAWSPRVDQAMPDPWRAMVQRMIAADPDARPTAREVAKVFSEAPQLNALPTMPDFPVVKLSPQLLAAAEALLNMASVAENGGNKASVAENGGNKASVAENGGNKASVAESGGNKASVAENGGNKASVAENGGNKASVAENASVGENGEDNASLPESGGHRTSGVPQVEVDAPPRASLTLEAPIVDVVRIPTSELHQLERPAPSAPSPLSTARVSVITEPAPAPAAEPLAVDSARASAADTLPMGQSSPAPGPVTRELEQEISREEQAAVHNRSPMVIAALALGALVVLVVATVIVFSNKASVAQNGDNKASVAQNGDTKPAVAQTAKPPEAPAPVVPEPTPTPPAAVLPTATDTVPPAAKSSNSGAEDDLAPLTRVAHPAKQPTRPAARQAKAAAAQPGGNKATPKAVEPTTPAITPEPAPPAPPQPKPETPELKRPTVF